MDGQVIDAEPTAVYDYLTAEGKILFQVCRYGTGEGKTFKQRRKGPQGFVWKLGDLKRVPYRLPDILANPDAILWVVEGEKDADRMAEAGSVATCNSGGAKKLQPELAQWFKGRVVAILPDNDEAGEAHAADVAKKLSGVASEIRIVRPPGLPPKGDVSDFLDRNTTLADLEWLFQCADTWKSNQPIELPFGQITPEERRKRASAYVAAMPAAIQGERGHDRLWRVACVLVNGFELDRQTAYDIIWNEFNPRCQPPWTDKDRDEINHKLKGAEKVGGERGYLLNQKPLTVKKPSGPAAPAKKVRMVTAEQAAVEYLGKVRTGGFTLTEMGLPSALNDALDGGVDFGEMVVIAARPSHGKSLVAMQCLYAAAGRGIPSLMVSAEMSAIALGKRTAQFVSSLPINEWTQSPDAVEGHVRQYFNGKSPVYIVDNIASIEEVESAIEHAVIEKGVRIAAVDYAQLLQADGKRSNYERASVVSTRLKQIATRLNIVLFVLCQLGRDVERRDVFLPKSTDIKDSGQFEQDADVVLMLCWTCKVDPKADKSEFIIFVDKNRNREIVNRIVKCKIVPARQKIESDGVANFEAAFEEYNHGELL